MKKQTLFILYTLLLSSKTVHSAENMIFATANCFAISGLLSCIGVAYWTALANDNDEPFGDERDPMPPLHAQTAAAHAVLTSGQTPPTPEAIPLLQQPPRVGHALTPEPGASEEADHGQHIAPYNRAQITLSPTNRNTAPSNN